MALVSRAQYGVVDDVVLRSLARFHLSAGSGVTMFERGKLLPTLLLCVAATDG
jgi:hypothetical protein